MKKSHYTPDYELTSMEVLAAIQRERRKDDQKIIDAWNKRHGFPRQEG